LGGGEEVTEPAEKFAGGEKLSLIKKRKQRKEVQKDQPRDDMERKRGARC